MSGAWTQSWGRGAERRQTLRERETGDEGALTPPPPALPILRLPLLVSRHVSMPQHPPCMRTQHSTAQHSTAQKRVTQAGQRAVTQRLALCAAAHFGVSPGRCCAVPSAWSHSRAERAARPGRGRRRHTTLEAMTEVVAPRLACILRAPPRVLSLRTAAATSVAVGRLTAGFVVTGRGRAAPQEHKAGTRHGRGASSTAAATHACGCGRWRTERGTQC